MTDSPVWDDFDRARAASDLAAQVHRNDVRKGPRAIPYLSHIWSVAALVLEFGGTSDQVAAAFLHDVAEDGGGERALAAIDFTCGPAVARMVRDLSDSLVDLSAGETKAPWHDRKQQYIEHAKALDAATLLVSACDKLHNLRSLVLDLRRDGDSVWNRFNPSTSPADHLWYYESLVAVYEAGGVDQTLVDELRRQLADVRDCVRSSGAGSSALPGD